VRQIMYGTARAVFSVHVRLSAPRNCTAHQAGGGRSQASALLGAEKYRIPRDAAGGCMLDDDAGGGLRVREHRR